MQYVEATPLTRTVDSLRSNPRVAYWIAGIMSVLLVISFGAYIDARSDADTARARIAEAEAQKEDAKTRVVEVEARLAEVEPRLKEAEAAKAQAEAEKAKAGAKNCTVNVVVIKVGC
jgi:predicted nuclease with TOPRIM domain